MNLNRKGYYTATVLGLIILAMGLGMGWFAGRTSEPQQPESITVKEPEEQEDTPVAAEEKFAVTTVNIFECGHIIERGENVTATAREAEGIMQQYGGYNYELKDGKMALYREFGYCRPEHYFTGEQNGKIAVFEADQQSFEKTEVCLLDIPAGSETYDELAAGMEFDALEDINLYIEGIEDAEGMEEAAEE